MMSTRAEQCIKSARDEASEGNNAEAFNLYLKILEENPDLTARLEIEFIGSFIELGELLAGDNKIDELFANFGKCIRIYPRNACLLHEMGKYLYSFGCYSEACHHFATVLEIDAGNVRAEKNLNSVKNLLVERWHFRMLNDKIRNDGYRLAMRDVVKSNVTTIIDVGTGTGLLSMYASECNPAAISACDGSEVMTTLTKSIVSDNLLLHPVLVLNKMSTSLRHMDLGGKRSLLITELFDAGLFGEHVLQALAHAWQNLLTDNAQVVPYGAEFFVLGAHSEMLNAKYQLLSNPKSFLNMSRSHVHILSYESYDCEDVHQYKDIKYLTTPATVVKVNFADLNDIQDKLNCAEPYSVELKALESGEINVLIGYFNLYLSSNITLTTDPRMKNRANAWQQAVFFDYLPRNIVTNENFNVNFLLNSGKITNQTDPNEHIMRISQETVQFLNDTAYMKMIKSCIGMAYVYLSQMTDISDVKVIDLSPFPVFGWFMLKRGIHSLTCYAKSDADKQFLETAFHFNSDLPLSKLKILTGDKWCDEFHQNDMFHVIFCNVLELGGDIDVEYNEKVQYLKFNKLIQGGLLMPSRVSLVGQIISSDWLNINNRVYDDNTGYKISHQINKYQVSQHFNLNIANLDYTALSDPIVLGNCYHLDSKVFNITMKTDGDAHAILCWYNIELMHSLEEISTNRPFSFIEGTAFLLDPTISAVKGKKASILCFVDNDGAYKLMLHKD